MDELLGEFLAETIEGLTILDSQLILLEQSPEDDARIGSIFRVVHTLKGTCGFFTLPRLEVLAHACENLLGQLRDKTLAVTPSAISLILKTSDRVRTILSTLEVTEIEPAGEDADLIAELTAFTTNAPAALESMAQEKPASLGDVGSKTALPVLVATADPVTDIEPVSEKNAGQPDTNAKVALEEKTSLSTPDTHETSASTASIRVHVDLLEDLMTTVSELVLTRNQLMQILRNEKDSAFSVPLQRLSHLTSELQEGVMRTRMQPIQNAWAKLPRLVRDLSLELNKKIDLKLSGADTELDRQVLEFIKDPLVHMVRNAADHGIEDPATRLAAKKPETGTISLKAYHDGGHIVIELADDGRGLNTASIRERIIQKKLATKAELDQLTIDQIHQFIFKPGFSTAELVSSISGRGVGMDVVLSNVEKISGVVELKSQKGQGSTLTIKIPLTLSIISVLIVESAGMRFAIPQVSVEEMVLPKSHTETRVEVLNGSPVLRLREHLLPLVSLSSLLHLDAATTYVPDESHIVVTRVGDQSFGIIVDSVHDCEEIVVKPVARVLRHIPLYSGNTILGDGNVIMILDPSGIASAMGMMTRQQALLVEKAAEESENAAKLSFFVFRAGDNALKATPLGQITRLEEIDRREIEYTNNKPVMQYRGKLMPLLTIDSSTRLEAEGLQQLLVFSDEQRCMGLLVDEIIDIVEDDFNIQFGSDRPGFLGSAVIGGRATDLIDTSYYLTQAYADWFIPHLDKHADATKSKRRILLLDDSQLFRHLAIPVLRLAGYSVWAVGSVDRALALHEEGAEFDAIITDIEMPDKSGFDFARTLRNSTRWRHLPLIALSSRATPHELERARELDFVDFIPKFDSDRLLKALAAAMRTARPQHRMAAEMEAA